MSSLRSCRAARIAFGAALIASVPRLIAAACADPRGPETAAVLGEAWLIAAIAGLVAFALAPRFPHVRIGVVPSVVLPSVGGVLLLPLTLHLGWTLLVGTCRGFGDWVALSLVCTGAAHVVGALLVGLRARDVVRGRKAMKPWTIYGWALLVSNLPLPVLAMPLVAITGLPIMIAIFAFDATLNREASRMHELELPVATIRRATM